MISRIDGCNNYIMYSDEINSGKSKYYCGSHEFYVGVYSDVAICGSPIELNMAGYQLPMVLPVC